MSIIVDVGLNHSPAAATAAVITIAAVAAKQHNIDCVVWSYSAAPTGGNLKVEDGAGVTVFSMDITSAGAGFIPFNPLMRGSVNTAMIVTLASGGGSVVGKVNVPAHWLSDSNIANA